MVYKVFQIFDKKLSSHLLDSCGDPEASIPCGVNVVLRHTYDSRIIASYSYVRRFR